VETVIVRAELSCGGAVAVSSVSHSACLSVCRSCHRSVVNVGCARTLSVDNIPITPPTGSHPLSDRNSCYSSCCAAEER